MLYPETGVTWMIFSPMWPSAPGPVEDQHHRMTVSGMDVPAGMKNPTSGDLSVMFNSVQAAQSKHNFIYRGWDVNTDGNDLAPCDSPGRCE